jgi:uncharacterized hydrophobic protein (TIGR00271 family)
MIKEQKVQDSSRDNHSDSVFAEKSIKSGPIFSLRQFLHSQRLTQTRKAIVLNDLVDAGSPGIDFLVLIIFSAAIATFGLLSDQSVVTIGAQLIDPLMSPILGLAIASLSGLQRMFRRSLLAVIEGAGLAVLLAAVLSFFIYRLPYGVNAITPHEVILRTSATPLDLGIAMVGGGAAAYALAHPRLDATLPGVAIATAIMPPLCTIGYGIAFTNTGIILGATLQFFTNFIAIAFAAVLTFALLGFRDIGNKKHADISRSVIISSIMMLIIAIPLGILAWNTFSAARLNSQARTVINQSLPASANHEIVDLVIRSQKSQRIVTVSTRLSRSLSDKEINTVKNSLMELLGDSLELRFVTLPMQIVN